MTSRQIELVQNSFSLVQPILDDAAVLFYDRLFTLDPSLRSMFRGSPEEQRRKLSQALTIVVKGIDRPEQIRSAVRALGERHGGYGVQAAHYNPAGAALLWTLEAGLGAAFTPEIREAWTAAYGWIADTMQQAVAA